jgi:hypothetical protein
MRRQAAVVLGLFLAGTALAVQPTPFTGFLHKSPTPQPVPDGTSTFVLSPTAPTGSPVVTEQLSVIKTQSASFPAFIAPPFPKDTLLPIKIGATVSLSANLGMGSCAQMDANILQIDPLGNETVAANVGLVAATIPQGSVNGTVGFATYRLTAPGISCTLLDGIPILEGGSVGLRLIMTNSCDANRTIFLAYDGAAAQSEVDFTVPTDEEELALRLACQQTCGTAKLRAAGAKVNDRTKCFEKAVLKALPVDANCLDRADQKLISSFAAIEDRGGCVFTHDAAAVEGTIASAIGAFVSDLTPPTQDKAALKCAALKIKAAGSKANDKIKCHATAFGKGQAIDPSCLTRANSKFANAFLKAQAKGGCATTGDAPTIEGIVDGLVDGVVSKLVPSNPI